MFLAYVAGSRIVSLVIEILVTETLCLKWRSPSCWARKVIYGNAVSLQSSQRPALLNVLIFISVIRKKFLIIAFYFLRSLFIVLERQSKRVRKEIFHLLIPFSNGCSSQGRSRSKAGTWKSIRCPLWVEGWALRRLQCCLPGSVNRKLHLQDIQVELELLCCDSRCALLIIIWVTPSLT